MRMSLNWDDLRYFLAVARAGQLTTAARRLKVDHTTCSRRIGALEMSLGARLFDRRPQGYFLTSSGEQLVVIAEAMETQVLEALNTIGDRDRRPVGVVRIGAPDGFGQYFIAQRISAFLESHPRIQIQLVAMPRFLSLSKREADIVITIKPPSTGRIVARKLIDFGLGLYASSSYLSTARPILSVNDIKQHPMIAYIDDFNYIPELDYLDEVAEGLEVRFQNSSMTARLKATLSGGGLCVLPHYIAKWESTLCPVLPGEIQLTRSYWLTVHNEIRELARVREVVDFLVTEVRKARRDFAAKTETSAMSGDMRPRKTQA